MTASEAIKVIEKELADKSMWMLKAQTLLQLVADYKTCPDMEKLSRLCADHAKS